MTFAQQIIAAIRSYIITSLTGGVVTDIAANGLSAEDQAIVDQFLAQEAP